MSFWQVKSEFAVNSTPQDCVILACIALAQCDCQTVQLPAIMEDVLLGYLGQKLDEEMSYPEWPPCNRAWTKLPANEEPALDIRSSRFGGAVVWNTQPSAESSVQRKDYLTCGICGEDLVLFVQLSAGYGDYPKRSLYVFGCRTSSCGLDVKAWRVLRSTGPLCSQARQKEASPAEAKAGGYASYVLDNSDDFFGTDDWSVPGGASLDADAEIEALLAARSKASPQKSKESKVTKEDKVPEVQDNASFWLGVREPPRRPRRWPCLSLSVDYEPWEAASSGDHEHELWQIYLQSELAGNEDLSSSGAMPKELEAEAAKLREEAGDSQPSGHEAGFGDEDEDDEDAEEAIRAGDKTAKVDWMMRLVASTISYQWQLFRPWVAVLCGLFGNTIPEEECFRAARARHMTTMRRELEVLAHLTW
eukprot:s2108_g2.t2